MNAVVRRLLMLGPRALPLIGLLLWPGALAAAAKTDADRIADVHALAAMAEAFKEACGHYPLADRYVNVAIAAHLSSHPLPEHYQFPPPGRSGVVLRPGEFEDYMRTTLGPGIEVPRDDRPVHIIPHYYIYLFDGTNYFVSAVLERPTEHTRNVADWYLKYEVGSKAVPERKIRRFGDLALEGGSP